MITNPTLDNTSPTDDPAGSIPALEPYVEQLALANAADLARGGHYQEAELILSGLVSGKNSPAVLDLLARIRAQQGQYLDAERLWREALEQDPNNPVYLEGLKFIQRSRRSSVFSRPTSVFVLTGIIIVLAAVVITWLVKLNAYGRQVEEVSEAVGALSVAMLTPQPTTDLPAVVVTQIPGLSLEEIETINQEYNENAETINALIADLSDQVLEIQEAQETLQTSLQPPTEDGFEIELDVEGVQMLADEGRWIVQFDEGLFLYDWLLRADAGETLQALSLQLKPYSEQIDIGIMGFISSDEEGTYLDLALMRSAIVLQEFQEIGQLPDEMFSIVPQGTTAAPYTNDTIANRARNRTVILILTKVDD